MGRPTDFTPEIATAICDQLMQGKSVRAICSAEEMPGETTIYRWLQNEENAAFREQYARARESQAERMLDEILEIADDTTRDTKFTDSGRAADTEWISRSRLRVDARKWAMSKLAPKKYGDKMALTDGEGQPLIPKTDTSKLSNEELQLMLALRRKMNSGEAEQG